MCLAESIQLPLELTDLAAHFRHITIHVGPGDAALADETIEHIRGLAASDLVLCTCRTGGTR
jgi:hypothetical protein